MRRLCCIRDGGAGLAGTTAFCSLMETLPYGRLRSCAEMGTMTDWEARYMASDVDRVAGGPAGAVVGCKISWVEMMASA